MPKNTLFEDLREEVKYEEGRSPFFYRRAFKRLTQKYISRENKLILEERLDSTEDEENQDNNLLRRYPRTGHIYLFEYKTEEKNISVFDPFPLVYVIKFNSKEFTGCNLHLIHPSKRKYVIDNLKNNKITLPYNTISKYIISQVDGLLLDIAFNEWEVASNLPIENLISIKDGKVRDLPLFDVWKEKNKTFRKMLVGTRIYKSYGSKDENFKGT